MLINVTIPVYNEEKILPKSIYILDNFLKKNLKDNYEIIIADNGSTDNTRKVAKGLEKEYKKVKLLKIPRKGRGRALKQTWSESKADILSYMDVDLSTDLKHFPRLISALKKGADIAYGSRLSKGSKTTRSFFRDILSRGYNLIVKLALSVDINDAQCGFKAIRKHAYQKLRPYLHDKEWFFDTELLVIACHEEYNLTEIPVEWIEDKDSKVQVYDTVVKYLKNIMKLRRRLN